MLVKLSDYASKLHSTLTRLTSVLVDVTGHVVTVVKVVYVVVLLGQRGTRSWAKVVAARANKEKDAFMIVCEE